MSIGDVSKADLSVNFGLISETHSGFEVIKSHRTQRYYIFCNV